jgi:hypothetical protein
MRRFLLGAAVAAFVACVSAPAVLAADPSKEKVALTAAGNAQARAEVLRRTDVGQGWTGGAKKPDLTGLKCSYKPKQSDLVIVGAAETTWQRQGFEVDSEAQVLRTPRMVRLDWQRSVLAPQVLPCLRESFQKQLGSTAKLVSIRRIAFPHLAQYAAAFRMLIDVTAGGGKVPVESDFVALGRGRNEISLSLFGPSAAKAVLRKAELRLARVLVARARS